MPDGFSLVMERFVPRAPTVELVPHDPYLATEHVFINHPSWKTREAMPIVWSELQESSRLYPSSSALALTTKRQIAWRVQIVDSSFWEKWELSVEDLPAHLQAVLHTALNDVGHLPYEITSYDATQRRCVLALTHSKYALPAHLTFLFRSKARSPNGSIIDGGTFVFEADISK
jgi:hypothetical protein